MKNKYGNDIFVFYEATLSVHNKQFDAVPVITQFGRTPGGSLLRLSICLANEWDRHGRFKHRAEDILGKKFNPSVYKSFRKKVGGIVIHRDFGEVVKTGYKNLSSSDYAYSLSVFRHEV